jgi:hypothetical protein
MIDRRRRREKTEENTTKMMMCKRGKETKESLKNASF